MSEMPVDLAEELMECTTDQDKWYGIKIDGLYYGEVVTQDNDAPGFNLMLFDYEDDALDYLKRVFEEDLAGLEYEIVQVDLKKAVNGG